MFRDCYLNAFVLISVSVAILQSCGALDATSRSASHAQDQTIQSSRQPPLSEPPVNKEYPEPEPTQLQEGGWIFEGLLAPDGSISTAALMIEQNPSAKDFSVEKPRRSISYVSGLQTSRPADDHHYPPCPAEFRDFIPCLSANASSRSMLERDCRRWEQVLQPCAIPTPENYARQYRWPTSTNQVRQPNVPNVPLLKNKEWQPWIQFHGSDIFLQPGEPNVPNGANEYFNNLSRTVPGLAFGEKVRVVLDIGCGAGHAAVDLETRGTITLSVPGDGSCDNGVQLILERGYPSIFQAFDKHRLPYPSQAFDLIHCAACNVDWEIDDGLKLLEADRILRAGGFFLWTDPSGAGTSRNGMEDLTRKICWKLVARVGRTHVWEKPTNNSCYLLRPSRIPPLCSASTQADTSWNIPLQRCLLGLPATGGAVVTQWPERMETPPLRLKEAPAAGLEQVKEETYKVDLNFWMTNVDIYVAEFGEPRLDDIRNVLDMNAGYGGFATAVLLRKPALDWWVLNVVPVNMPDRLALIFDRGLIGVYHDWCSPFQLHPRSFDLVHAYDLFSSRQRCSMDHMVRDIDRLLRPGGFALIRDNLKVLERVQDVATSLRWKAMLIDTESGPKGKNKVLSCQKTFWRAQSH